MGSARVHCFVFAIAVAAICSSLNAYAFGPSSLNGTYILSVEGFTRDSNGESGNLSLTGLIAFNGSGSVKQIDITVSAFDRTGDSENCVIRGAATAGLSFYAVNADGSGDLSIGIPFNSCLDNSLSSNGSIQFNLFLPTRSTGGATKMISTGTFSNLTDQSGDSIANLLLTGTLTHQ